MATIKDVPLWAISRGISHAVAYTRDHYVTTLCEMWGNMRTRKSKTARVCKKCRERLPKAELTNPHPSKERDDER